jgi:large subunit ribosomal protein L21
MYAVIENGGKQYRVELGAELELDQLAADPGARIDIGRVLLVADGEDALIGRPVVEGAKVTAEVLRPARGEKLIVFKYKPKARRRVKHGHRQDLTIVRVADIEWAGRSAAKEARAAESDAQQARTEAAKSAEAKAKADAALANKLAADKAPKAADKPDRKTKQTSAKAPAKQSTAKAAPKPATAKATAKAAAKPSTSSKSGAVTPKKSAAATPEEKEE